MTEMGHEFFWRKMIFDMTESDPESPSIEQLTVCDDAPHGDYEQNHGWNAKKKKKRGRELTEEREMEYKFLYAAEAHCLQCLQYYASQPGFDLSCTSSGKGAREWASAKNDGIFPIELEMWLRSNDM